MIEILPKEQIIRWLRAFKADEKRGIHFNIFVENLAGVSNSAVFAMMQGDERIAMSPESQARLSRAIHDWTHGWIRVMTRKQQQWIEYRKVPEPKFVKRIVFEAQPGACRVRPGVINRRDY